MHQQQQQERSTKRITKNKNNQEQQQQQKKYIYNIMNVGKRFNEIKVTTIFFFIILVFNP